VSFPKPAPSRLARFEARYAADQAAAAFRRVVLTRDDWHCRACGCHVVTSLAAVPHRAEVHHLRSRLLLTADDCLNPALAVVLCLRCHLWLKVTPPKLHQVGRTAATVTFERR
jgi:hypothetical protein